MKLPLSWLSEYVKINGPPTALAERLTLAGFEVTRTIDLGAGFSGVTAGLVTTVAKHPNADKLSVATINGGKRTLTIVFGKGVMLKPGMVIPVAVAPTVLPSGQTIERRNLRGVTSEGMLCVDSELFAAGAGTLTNFPATTKPGTPAAALFGLAGSVLELDVPTNRPDCFSIYGLAREVAALTGATLKPLPTLKVLSRRLGRRTSVRLSARVAAATNCRLYVLEQLSHVTPARSPVWLKSRLLAAGVRPINAVVDAANYVMLETGQPLHVFDAQKVGSRIDVRLAQSGESIVCLDGVTRTLPGGTVVIADGAQPLAIAGIMGGSGSAVGESTKEVIIESAAFDPVLIRKASQRLGLRSEASTRFEKRIDATQTIAALERCAALIADLIDAEAVGAPAVVGRPKANVATIVTSVSHINGQLGTHLSATRIGQYLKRFGLQVAGSKMMRITVPSWRPDLTLAADIVEEVGRSYGYDKLEGAPFSASLIAYPEKSRSSLLATQARQYLTAAGVDEVYRYSFYGRAEAEASGVPLAEHFEVENPMNPEQQYLRTSLVPLLEKTVAQNRQERESVTVFEIGKVFKRRADGSADERLHLAVVSSDAHNSTQFKGIIDGLLTQLGPELNGKPRGTMVVGDAVRFWLSLDDLASRAPAVRRFTPLPTYPAVKRDLAFLVDVMVDYQKLVTAIRSADPLVSDVEFLNVYHGKNVPEGHMSLALHIDYRSLKGTLTAAEATRAHERVVAILKEQFKITER